MDVCELISKTMYQYNGIKGIKYPDYFIACLVSQSSLYDLEEKNKLLIECATCTHDQELKNIIIRDIEYNDRQLKSFKDNNTESIYICYVKYDEENDWEICGYFKDYGLIEKYVKELNVKCKIDKMLLINHKNYNDTVKDILDKSQINYDLGTIYYNSKGSIISIITNEVDDNYLLYAYEQKFYPLDYPFRKGDVVYDIELKRLGVVNCIEDDAVLLKHNIYYGEKDENGNTVGDVTDIMICVDYKSPNGEWMHYHPIPTVLDYDYSVKGIDLKKEWLKEF